MPPGTILRDEAFEFHDGPPSPKYMIVLTDGSMDADLVVTTTSNPRRKGMNAGCQSWDVFPNFHLESGSCPLSGPSWVIFKPIYEFTADHFNQHKFTGRISAAGRLNARLTQELLTCIAEADKTTRQVREALVAQLDRIT